MDIEIAFDDEHFLEEQSFEADDLLVRAYRSEILIVLRSGMIGFLMAALAIFSHWQPT